MASPSQDYIAAFAFVFCFQVARADPSRFEVVNWAKNPGELRTHCWLRALQKHSVDVVAGPEAKQSQ